MLPATLLLEDHFITHRRQLRDAAARILGCRQQADDVVQDAYLKVGAMRPAPDVLHALPYLRRMVRNLAIDRYRRSAFEASVFEHGQEAEVMPPVPDTPESILIGRQCLRQLDDALAQLPERTRRAFELHRLEEHSQREIAARFAVSTTLVNAMIRAATLHCRAAVR